MLPSLQSIFSMPSSATGRVEKATSRLLISPDWMLNMEICNAINSDPWKAKAFVKAVKMRLRSNNSKVQFLSLALLETMVKKCDDFVHFQVVERGILSEMVKILRKSKNMQVKEKILVLLESWQEAFRGPDGRYPQFYNVYAELKRDGLQFPGIEKSSELKVAPRPATNQLQIGYDISTKANGMLDKLMPPSTSPCSLSDLYNIRSVVELFTNMLQAVNPNDHKAVEDEVITDLSKQCVTHQKKLMQLINSTENDMILVEALSLNDSVQAAFSKHEALLARYALPTETAINPTRPKLPPRTPQGNRQVSEKEEDEDDDDGFSIIAKRNLLHKSKGTQVFSANHSELSNAIVLFDPPAPVSSSSKEQDLIDLFSVTPSSSHTQNPISDSLSWEQYLNHPHPLMSNESHNSYVSYIAPWARPSIDPLPEKYAPFPQQYLNQYQTTYLPPSGSHTEGSSNNPFLSTAYPFYPVSQQSRSPPNFLQRC